jgi:hypothetical protein
MAARPVKIFAAVLFKDENALQKALPGLAAFLGEVDYQGKSVPFDVTGYYEKEMGAPLFRRIVSFEILTDPARLPEIKNQCAEIEKSLAAAPGGRTVNIDAGYLDFDKAVLASTKQGPYKVYMRDGIWADMTLHYEKGRYTPFAWSFADFRDGRYEKDFLRIREIYKKQTK